MAGLSAARLKRLNDPALSLSEPPSSASESRRDDQRHGTYSLRETETSSKNSPSESNVVFIRPAAEPVAERCWSYIVTTDRGGAASDGGGRPVHGGGEIDPLIEFGDRDFNADVRQGQDMSAERVSRRSSSVRRPGVRGLVTPTLVDSTMTERRMDATAMYSRTLTIRSMWPDGGLMTSNTTTGLGTRQLPPCTGERVTTASG